MAVSKRPRRQSGKVSFEFRAGMMAIATPISLGLSWPQKQIATEIGTGVAPSLTMVWMYVPTQSACFVILSLANHPQDLQCFTHIHLHIHDVIMSPLPIKYFDPMAIRKGFLGNSKSPQIMKDLSGFIMSSQSVFLACFYLSIFPVSSPHISFLSSMKRRMKLSRLPNLQKVHVHLGGV